LIPTYEEFMYPFLEVIADNEVHRIRDIYEKLADEFELTEEERNQYIASGSQQIYKNRIGWAGTYLFKASLVSRAKRGSYQITDKGRSVLNDPNINYIDKAFLHKYDSFIDFVKPQSKQKVTPTKSANELNPEEQLADSYVQLKETVKNELLNQIMNSSPKFFEDLVIHLLVEMGYGGSIEAAGKAIGGSGDEGIDGVIKEDILGLDMIYIQAKRWKGNIGRPDIQQFVGSLTGKQAHKGVFITTSDYTKEAREYIKNITPNIILINGDELTEYMYEYDVGVLKKAVYISKEVNEAYFDE